MEWYQYVEVFFSGAFLSNAIPHFVHGISGDKFPTPFSKPPGKGLSPAIVNVVWGVFNILVGVFLFWVSKQHHSSLPAVIVFFVGFIVMALMLSNSFTKKHKE